MKHLFLDSYPMSLLAKPNTTPDVAAILTWFHSIRAAGHLLYIPEVIDYEVRRELVRAGKTSSVTRLDLLKLTATYVPINSQAMLLAADLWAQARNAGQSTGDPKKLDINVILAAQTLTVAATSSLPLTDFVIVTSNVGHLSRFGVPAEEWTDFAL
jgi:predicted nucleic acid-binding protein